MVVAEITRTIGIVASEAHFKGIVISILVPFRSKPARLSLKTIVINAHTYYY